ncbi:hypothetical protein [Actinomycetospora sp. NBRC 106378]|uniref:hypothetical protein n=1 Tax=Actinomycetospora sp. NBRC 106378 TaxID=3032208 RepID=UPI0024A18F9F|nr:hypothetical protein [Actinomycetospora sp. NBRC 106378]GLZ51402.1 hypothetical protein Acsp07_10190 [Actinomycetospora sp. NBRC 106378]
MSAGIVCDERVESAVPSSRPDLHVVVATPGEDPWAWRCYREGLREAYEYYGVGAAQNLDESRTALFITVFTAAGHAVGGARFLGPHREAAQIDTLALWRDEPAAWAALTPYALDGVVDLEGAWVRRGVPERAAVVAAVRRMPLDGAAMLGVRWCVAAAAEHSLPLWLASGCEILDVPSVPYPDERYATRLVVWDGDRGLVPAPRTAADDATEVRP